MNPDVNQLARSLTGKESISDCSDEELQSLVTQYPYFGPAQLLLLKKLQAVEGFVPAGMRERASLYFPNSLWMDQLLENEMKTSQSVEEPVMEKPAGPIPAPVPDLPMLKEAPQEEATVPMKEESMTDHAKADASFIEETEEHEEPTVTGNEPAEPLLRMPSLEIEPIDPSKAELVFEPYHTVDYFASQGVRVKEDEKPKDRFSLQLKSFTEWLKTMKRQTPAEISAAASVSIKEEQKVEELAQHSIDDREVVTEAMAEVWEKQGNHDKAREIYQKLSLLDPAKSSYFAAKIDHLKQL